jgi:hypothetical protein
VPSKILMMPLCSHGLKEDHARFFYQQIILALDYCHKMNISNRDIKLENTLLDSTEPGRNPLIKLCDFGYSINESHSLPKTAVGTPGYTGECQSCPACAVPCHIWCLQTTWQHSCASMKDRRMHSLLK